MTDIDSIPDVGKRALEHVFEDLKIVHEPDTLWLEFGVFNGSTINYISGFTENEVFGFDSFEGLPEKWRDGYDAGFFDLRGNLPRVRENVRLIKGWFSDTLGPFFEECKDKKVAFAHIDCDLYSSTKCILEFLKTRMKDDCIVVFDELVNYPGYDGDTGELKAWNEFITENKVEWEWIGMYGKPRGMIGAQHESVAVRVKHVG